MVVVVVGSCSAEAVVRWSEGRWTNEQGGTGIIVAALIPGLVRAIQCLCHLARASCAPRRRLTIGRASVPVSGAVQLQVSGLAMLANGSVLSMQSGGDLHDWHEGRCRFLTVQ